MQKHLLPKPTPDEMYAALCRRDSEYEGIFFFGVWTTGVFCRPTCPARNPKRDNISFYPKASDALAAGFRPCKRCEPMEAFGAAPTWMKRLLVDVERDPSHRWTDAELRQRDIDPKRVRRWFKKNHGLTFHGYLRARRLGTAIGQIHSRHQSTTHAALANGYESLSGFNEAFQMNVWKQLCLIPTGTTISYTDLARNIGKPSAQRAVGRANGDNRLAIIIPCHRVVRDNGTLSGYGGGVWRKQWLLNHEQQSSES